MRSPHRRFSYLMAACLFFIFMPYSRGGSPAAPITATQEQGAAPFEKQSLTDLLRTGDFKEQELIEMVARRGVNFRPTTTDEEDIRLAGSYLGEKAVNELIEAVRLNYLRAEVSLPIALRLGKPARIKYLDFKGTYAKRAGDDYSIIVDYPGADHPAEISTHTGCEHAFSWGGRNFTLRITSASPEQVTALLINNTETSAPPNCDSAWVQPQPPPQCVIHLSPCLAIRMWLVSGNYTGAEAPLLHPYYISEPLTVGILKYYARLHTPKTAIPPGAKDSDYITEIYDADALDIATMRATRPPSYDQLINAFRAGVLKPTAAEELVRDEHGKLLTVKVPGGDSHINKPPAAPGLAKGLLRLVHEVSPGTKKRPFVTTNPPNSQ
jgi:hypothetical protein